MAIRLSDPEDEEPGALEPEVWYLERVGREVFWQTADGALPCPTPFARTLRVYPELVRIDQNRAVPLSRFRKIERMGWAELYLWLDSGIRLQVSPVLEAEVAEALGCDTLQSIDATDAAWLAEVRDTPYDLLDGEVPSASLQCCS